MKALVRKEATELGLSFVPILIAICVAWFATLSVENVLIGPAPGRMTAVLFASAGGGLLFACTQLAGERIRGTWGFLVHRGAGIEGCFRTKASVGAAASVLLGLVPPLVFAIVHATILGEGRIVQWSRVVEYSSTATVGASSYAITALALCLRRRSWSDVLLAVVGVAGWLMLSVPMTFYVANRLGVFADEPAILAGFAVLQVAVAIGVLRFAERILGTWRDPSLPLSSPHHAGMIGLGLLLWVPIQLALLMEIQNELGRAFLRRAPSILRDRVRGDFIVAVPNGSGSYSALRDGRIVEDERLLDLRGVELFPVIYSSERKKTDLDAVYVPQLPSIWDRERLIAAYRSAVRGEWSWQGEALSRWDRSYFDPHRGGYWTSLWLDRSEGCLRLFGIRYHGSVSSVETNTPSFPPSELPFERILKKPGGRFSKSTVVLDATVREAVRFGDKDVDFSRIEEKMRSKCVVDVEDHSVWRFDTDFSSPLQRLELPNGDRIVGFGEAFFRRDPLALGRYLPWLCRCIRGEKGYYEWNGSELAEIKVNASNIDGVPGEIADSLVEIQAVRTDHDPLFPVVEVRDARTGATLFTHRYAPIGSGDKAFAGLLCLGAILRPAVLDALSYFQSSSEPSLASNVFEALLANQSRVWLLAFSCLLSIGLAWLAASRARERGASSFVVKLTAVVVAAIGVTAFLMVWMLESRKSRPRGASRVEPRAEPVVLIETARAT